MRAGLSRRGLGVCGGLPVQPDWSTSVAGSLSIWQKVQVTPPTSSLKPFGGDLRNDRKAVRDISPTNALAAALIRLMGGLVEGERSYSTKSLFELVSSYRGSFRVPLRRKARAVLPPVEAVCADC